MLLSCFFLTSFSSILLSLKNTNGFLSLKMPSGAQQFNVNLLLFFVLVFVLAVICRETLARQDFQGLQACLGQR